MLTGDRLVAGGLAAVMFAWFLAALRLPYVVNGQPGPGFFPVWLSALGLALSLILMIGRVRRRGDGGETPPTDQAAVMEPAATRQADEEQPEGVAGEEAATGGGARLFAAFSGMIAFLLLVSVLGFVVSLTIYLLYLSIAIMRLGIWRSLAVSMGTMLFIHIVFGRLLDIPFPQGMVGI